VPPPDGSVRGLATGQAQRLALVEYIDLLPLPLREGVGTVNAPYDHHAAEYEKDDGKETERREYVDVL